MTNAGVIGVAATNESSSAKTESAQRFQFGLGSLLVLPILISLLGMVGVWYGWPLACVLSTIPIGFVLWRIGTPALNAAGVAVALSLLIGFLVLPYPGSHGPGRRATCMNNLSQIAKALVLYEADNGSFPPLYTTDDKGRPLVSWRAMILPYLGGRDMYEACRFDEPWNSPANSQLASVDLQFMRCPSDRNSRLGETSYLADVGPGTVWSTDGPIGFDDIDDASRTVLLVEVADSGISWMEPRDLSLQDALSGINAEPGPCISSGHPGCVNVIFADGHSEVLHESMAIDELRDLLTFEKRESHAKALRREEEVGGTE